MQVFKCAIVHEASNSKIEALNSRAHSLHGANPSMVLIDELHEVPHQLFNVLRTSFGARQNPLLMVLTTAGRDMMGIAYETRSRVLKVLDGVLDDDRLSGAVFSLDPGDAWDDERTWIKANPMLDDPTPTLSELRQLALEAKHTPSQELSFRQFYANEWLQVSASAWLSPEDLRGVCRSAAPSGGFHRRADLGRIRLGAEGRQASVAVITLERRRALHVQQVVPAEGFRRPLREADSGIRAVGEGRITRSRPRGRLSISRACATTSLAA